PAWSPWASRADVSSDTSRRPLSALTSASERRVACRSSKNAPADSTPIETATRTSRARVSSSTARITQVCSTHASAPTGTIAPRKYATNGGRSSDCSVIDSFERIEPTRDVSGLRGGGLKRGGGASERVAEEQVHLVALAQRGEAVLHGVLVRVVADAVQRP